MSGSTDLVALDALIEELTVDAYGDEEQLGGFLTGAEDRSLSERSRPSPEWRSGS